MVTLCQSEGTHRNFISFSPPVVGTKVRGGGGAGGRRTVQIIQNTFFKPSKHQIIEKIFSHRAQSVRQGKLLSS